MQRTDTAKQYALPYLTSAVCIAKLKDQVPSDDTPDSNLCSKQSVCRAAADSADKVSYETARSMLSCV
jgi:hypothetical protein